MSREQTRTLRVLTLNLWGLSGAWEERRSVIEQGLRHLEPDLIAFQEPVVSETYDQVADLLGAEYHVAHESRGLVPGASHQGASIASRWPIAAVHEVDLHLTPRTADFPCTTLVVELTAPEPVGSMLFVNHLPSWQPSFELERELQAGAAARFIEKLVAERADPHVVLASDFSSGPDAADVRFWSGRQSLGGISVCYRDAWESIHPDEAGFTMSPRNPLTGAGAWPARRIDYVMVRCPERGGRPTLSVKRCELAFDQPVGEAWASDHYGVVADLEALEGAERPYASGIELRHGGERRPATVGSHQPRPGVTPVRLARLKAEAEQLKEIGRPVLNRVNESTGHAKEERRGAATATDPTISRRCWPRRCLDPPRCMHGGGAGGDSARRSDSVAGERDVLVPRAGGHVDLDASRISSDDGNGSRDSGGRDVDAADTHVDA